MNADSSPLKIVPDDSLLSVGVDSSPQRGVGRNEEWFKQLIRQYPLLKVDEQRALLSEFVGLQHKMLEVIIPLRFPFAQLIASQKFDEARMDETSDDGEGKTPSAGANKMRYKRRPFITREIADAIQTAQETVHAARGAVEKEAALHNAVEEIFELVGYTVIRNAADPVPAQNIAGKESASGLQPLPSAKRVAVQKWIVRCQEIRTLLHHHNARLVMAEAKSLCMTSSAYIDDLLQEGSMGLQTAIDRYMPQQGTDDAFSRMDTQLSTVAKRWIRAKMTRWLSDNSKTIRIPDHLNKKTYKLQRAMREAQAARPTVEEAEITDRELSERSGLSVNEVHALRYVIPKTVSMNEPVKGGEEDSGATAESFIADPSASHEKMVDDLDAREMRPAIYEALSKLDLSSRMILSFKFGVPGAKESAQMMVQFYEQECMGPLNRRFDAIKEEAARSPERPAIDIKLGRLPRV
jgi:RNA polymerase sigma factor (sigma-70 family)